MIRYMNKLMVAGMVGLVWVAPAAADGFGVGLNFSQGRSGPQIGVALRWADEPLVARPVATQSVWVPTVQQTYRDVPVTDAWGRVISYRRELVAVQSGQWVTVSQPVVPAARTSGFGWTNWKGDHDDYRGHEVYRPQSQWYPRWPAAGGSRAIQYIPKGGHHADRD